ncbi:MAG TPA: hypothetical protein VMR34_02395 [Candidatus Saccharimonadales bacterium]|nr:hypothetical protein [Candidatus Saccharimonadales bacterium]
MVTRTFDQRRPPETSAGDGTSDHYPPNCLGQGVVESMRIYTPDLSAHQFSEMIRHGTAVAVASTGIVSDSVSVESTIRPEMLFVSSIPGGQLPD